jgi:hypothetical protein
MSWAFFGAFWLVATAVAVLSVQLIRSDSAIKGYAGLVLAIPSIPTAVGIPLLLLQATF